MAIAKYFTKNALAIQQVLKKSSFEEIEKILENHIIEIAFDDICYTAEGNSSLDLAIKLICRLYPKIKITPLSENAAKLAGSLVETARNINSNIEVTDLESTVSLVIGNTPITRKGTLVFYIGSDTWIAKLSTNSPVGSQNSNLPFAAGFAACLAAANIFRFVFRPFLKNVKFDEEIQFSLIHLCSDSNSHNNAMVTIEDLGYITVLGLGAIGNGITWALSQMKNTEGKITIIDPEVLEQSNLQRYIESLEHDIDEPKINIVERSLSKTKFKVNPYKGTWQDFLSITKQWKNDFVLCALDTARDRIFLQTSLPNKIINGFTDEGMFGISRHLDFIKEPCIGCLYIPTEKKMSYSEEVAHNLGISKDERIVREYLYFDKLITLEFIQLIAVANGIEISKLEQFIGLPTSTFYSKFVCGGIMLGLTKENEMQQIKVETPLAFQSAMAGILVVAELIVNKYNLRASSNKGISHFYPLNPIVKDVNPYHHSVVKNKAGNCICGDDYFTTAYKTKYF